MSSKRAKLLVLVIWVFSFIVCCPPLIGWNSLHSNSNDVTHSNILNQSSFPFPYIINKTSLSLEKNANNSSLIHLSSSACNHSSSSASHKSLSTSDLVSNCYQNTNERINASLTKCELTNSRGYRIYASFCSFYIPMIVMVFFYITIYRAARRTITAFQKGELKTKYSSAVNVNGSKSNSSVTLRVHRGGGSINTNSSGSYPHSPITKTHSSEDTTLVSLTELTTPENQNGENCKSKLNRIGSHNGSSMNRGGSCKAYNHSRKTNIRATRSFTNGFHGFRFSSNDSEDNGNCSTKTEGGEDGRIKQRRAWFKSNHNNRLSSSSQSSDYFSDSLSRDSLEKNRTRSRKNVMLSVYRPANTMKLHMQKFNREKKAAKTLAIIVGAFILCWLPFFTIYLIGAFCDNCISSMVFSIAFWLGYCNSAVNPCVYALFSRDFRAAFRKLILCRVGPIRSTLSFHSQQTRSMDIPDIHLQSASGRDQCLMVTDVNPNSWR